MDETGLAGNTQAVGGSELAYQAMEPNSGPPPLAGGETMLTAPMTATTSHVHMKPLSEMKKQVQLKPWAEGNCSHRPCCRSGRGVVISGIHVFDSEYMYMYGCAVHRRHDSQRLVLETRDAFQ